jgi:hypothetical protein
MTDLGTLNPLTSFNPFIYEDTVENINENSKEFNELNNRFLDLVLIEDDKIEITALQQSYQNDVVYNDYLAEMFIITSMTLGLFTIISALCYSAKN